jgi:ATP-dependent Clp protease ATP-binding subunit ClpA
MLSAGVVSTLNQIRRGGRGIGNVMMSDFTPRGQQVLALARQEAERFNHHYVGTEHLLLVTEANKRCPSRSLA